jgi:hypothetical protein
MEENDPRLQLDGNGRSQTVDVEYADLKEMAEAVTDLLGAFAGDSNDDEHDAAWALCELVTGMLERAGVTWVEPPDPWVDDE